MPETNVTSERIEELIGVFQQLVIAIEPRSSAPTTGLSGEEQKALFTYQWITGHLGRSDVVAPVLPVDKRSKGRVVFATAPPAVATHARIYAEDGAVEQVAMTEPLTVLDLTIGDDVAIAFVEFCTEHGAPVAIAHHIPAI